MLYWLVLTDPELSYDGYSNDFSIGIFRTEQEAQETAQYYLKNVRGFRDHPCTFRIIEKEWVGSCDLTPPDTVWVVEGWNTNENLDEIDLIQSPCFATQAQAQSALVEMKKQDPRTEWAVNRWVIGALDWQEGFVRMPDDPPKNEAEPV